MQGLDNPHLVRVKVLRPHVATDILPHKVAQQLQARESIIDVTPPPKQCIAFRRLQDLYQGL